MIEQDNLDEILRNSIKMYQPEPGLMQRKHFMEEVCTVSRIKTERNRLFYALIVAGLLLIGVITTLVFVFEPNLEKENTKEISIHNYNAKGGTPHGNMDAMANDNPSKLTDEKTSNAIAQTVKNGGSESDHSFIVTVKSETIPLSKASPGTVDSENETFDLSDQNRFTKKDVALSTSDTATKFSATTTQTELDGTEKDIPERKPAPKSNHAARLNLYYRPEMVYNIIENEKLIHSFGLEFQSTLFDNSYILGFGLGLSISNGYYEYAINYNEFLGTFKKLDSISFQFNEQNFQMTQTVHTTESQVFDTAMQTEYARVYRQLVYLQIPFILGYDVVVKDNYRLGIRFSPILSILLTNKPIDLQYDAGLNQIVQINRITPERIRTNWQLTAGFNYTRFTKSRLFFALEPYVTYYFNSVYQKSTDANQPYGLGIRLAIGIH